MSALTVSQLKDELKKRKVAFEEGRLKKYYVDLHDNLSRSRKSSRASSYSDDEDSSSRLGSPKARRAIARQKPSTPTKSGKDEEEDYMLRVELTKRGHTPGPITASTRDLYRHMLKESMHSDGGFGSPRRSNSTSGTQRQTHSAPGTPSKKRSKHLLMSDEEGTSDTDGGSPRGRSRSNSVNRRRSEVDKLKLDHPGPRMADSVPPTDGGPNTRSRRPGHGRDDFSPEPTGRTVRVRKSTGLLGGSVTRQRCIMLLILVVLGISAVFALRHGVHLPIMARLWKR